MSNLPMVVPVEPNQPVDLRRWWATIARSAWIIVVCVGLAVAAGVVAAGRVEPLYQSEITVRIDEPRPTGMSQYYFGPDYQQLLATSTEIITSRNLALEVVDSLGLRLAVAQPQRTPRSSLVQWAVISSDAPETEYRLTRATGGYEIRRLPGETVLGTFSDTMPIELPGLRFQLSPEGRLVERTLPGGQTARFTYDAAGQLSTLRDFAGDTTRFSYGDSGELTERTDPGGAVERRTYDTDDRLIGVTDPRGTTALSPKRRTTSSIGTPSRSAAICANVVSWPWPCGEEPDRMTTRPLGSIVASALSHMPPARSTYIATALPRACRSSEAGTSPSSSTARSRHAS